MCQKLKEKGGDFFQGINETLIIMRESGTLCPATLAMNQGMTMANSILELPCTGALDHARAEQSDTTGHSSNDQEQIYANENRRGRTSL